MMTIKSNLNIPFIALGVIVAALCATFIMPIFKVRQLSMNGELVSLYDDRGEKTTPGNSEVSLIRKDSSGLQLQYILRPGFAYPYAGILITLADSANRYFDCSGFNAIKITVASSQQSDCKVYLKVFDDNISRNGDPLSERYLKQDLFLNQILQTNTIRFKDFSTPEWWFQKNNITLKDVAPIDYSKVIAVQIESGSTATTGIIDTLTISNIRFTQSPNGVAVILLALLLTASCSCLLLRLLPRRHERPVIITYDKKVVPNYRDIDAQRIAEYLAKHFSEPDITILSAGKALGLSQKKVARSMNDEFKMSFRQYLTSIRIHEAKRLLLESDRLVIDIALQVGFNNISHFNRVFKTTTQARPLEFRNSKDAG